VTGAELEQLCSHLQLPPGSRGILARPGGPLFADRIVTDLRRWCETMGVRFIEHSPVVAVEEDGTVVTARGGRLVGDLVVAAAGAWLPGLMPDRFGHLPTYRQALCYVEAPPQHRESWQRAPALVVLGDRNVYSLPPLAGTGLKFGYGPHRRLASPTAGFDWTIDEGRLVIDGFGPFLRDADQYTPLRMQVGYYVMDATRRFRIEQTGRRLCVTNCDGQMFKFGPLVGERIMTAFEGGISAGDLARWAAGELPPHADARHR
jgi:sarcosine oxidase